MPPSLLNAYTVVLILLLGYSFKRLGLITMANAKALTNVVIYLTLPCSIIAGSSGDIDFDYTLLLISPIAFVICAAFPLVGCLRYKGGEQRVFAMLNLGGYNIGNFMLPFMQSIMSAQGFLAMCIFGVVNAFFCFGGVYFMALWFNRKDFKGAEDLSVKKFAKQFLKSIPPYCFLLSILFAMFSVHLPPEILHPLKSIGSANPFLCMFVIGVALKFKIPLEVLKKILEVLMLRCGTGIACAALLWFVLPFTAEIRLVLMAIVLAPITSMASITAIRNLPQFAEETADLNMISLVTSVVMITLLNIGYSLLA